MSKTGLITRVENRADKPRRLACRACKRSVRDFVADGTGLPSSSVDYAMVFNILHAEQPQRLLKEAYRLLVPSGLLGIIHWNFDPSTPRGPSMEILPRPEQCRDWAVAQGFRPLPPWDH